MLKLISSELQQLAQGVVGPSLPVAPVLYPQEPAYFLDQPEMIFNRSAAEHVISQLQAGIDVETMFLLDEVPLLFSQLVLQCLKYVCLVIFFIPGKHINSSIGQVKIQ